MRLFHTSAQRRLRNPAYVGANRCAPCTVLNLLIATVGSVLVATVSMVAAVVFLMLALVKIWFHGYLIPGTPTITRRYFPARLLRWFGKDPEGRQQAFAAFDVEGYLVKIGIIQATESDLALVPAFERRLNQYAASIEESEFLDRAGEFLDVDPASLSVTTTGSKWEVQRDGQVLGRWESRTAFLIDLAAERIVSNWDAGWSSMHWRDRCRTFAAIRACLDTCPICRSSVTLDTEKRTTCCREYTAVVATCEGCNSRLFELDTTTL
ncbi:MAG: hypothetical protein ACOCY6_04410 [Halodesulfurarchaeum sp.]